MNKQRLQAIQRVTIAKEEYTRDMQHDQLKKPSYYYDLARVHTKAALVYHYLSSEQTAEEFLDVVNQHMNKNRLKKAKIEEQKNAKIEEQKNAKTHMQKVIIIKPAKNSNSGGVSYITREIYNDFPANGNLGNFYTSDVEGLGEDVGVNVAGDIEDLIVCNEDGKLQGLPKNDEATRLAHEAGALWVHDYLVGDVIMTAADAIE